MKRKAILFSFFFGLTLVFASLNGAAQDSYENTSEGLIISTEGEGMLILDLIRDAGSKIDENFIISTMARNRLKSETLLLQKPIIVPKQKIFTFLLNTLRLQGPFHKDEAFYAEVLYEPCLLRRSLA